jgi:hypothetical protein
MPVLISITILAGSIRWSPAAAPALWRKSLSVRSHRSRRLKAATALICSAKAKTLNRTKDDSLIERSLTKVCSYIPTALRLFMLHLGTSQALEQLPHTGTASLLDMKRRHHEHRDG